MSRKNLNKKKYQSTAPVSNDEKEARPEARSWELKSIFFVFRAAAVLFFIAYLFMTCYASYTWVWIKWVQHQPTDYAVTAADKYLNKSDKPQDLVQWLSVRPVAEHDKLISLLDVFTPKMDANTFFLFSRWMIHEKKIDDARFWWMMGNYRIRFDLIRCGGDAVKFMNDLMEESSAEREEHLFRGDIGLKKRTLQRVLDYDATHPAHNNPTFLCKAIWRLHQQDITNLAIMPPYTWADTRASMRRNALRFINGEDAPAAIGKKSPLATDVKKDAVPAVLPKTPPKISPQASPKTDKKIDKK